MKGLRPPFGVGSHCPDFIATKLLSQLLVPVDLNTQRVKFRPLLMAIIRARLDIWLYNFPNEDALLDVMQCVAPDAPRCLLREAFPRIVRSSSSSTGEKQYTLQFIYSITRMQRRVRKAQLGKRMRTVKKQVGVQLAKLSNDLGPLSITKGDSAVSGVSKEEMSRVLYESVDVLRVALDPDERSEANNVSLLLPPAASPLTCTCTHIQAIPLLFSNDCDPRRRTEIAEHLACTSCSHMHVCLPARRLT